MNSDLAFAKGAKNFMSWLLEQDFTIELAPCSSILNQCNWIAYKRSKLLARRCECNQDKKGIILSITPYNYSSHSLDVIGIKPSNYDTSSSNINCEIEIRGQVNGAWYQVKSFGVNVNDLMSTEGKLEEIESNLITAWNAIKPEPVD